MTASIGILVSGHAEEVGVPLLLRRLMHEQFLVFEIQCGKLLRKPESDLLHQKKDMLERSVQRLAQEHDAVLVVVDLEDDCPAEWGPKLQQRAQAARPDKPVQVVCVYREFSTWFLWDAERLWGKPAPSDPEVRRGSKEWIRKEYQDGYSERHDSPGLCGRLDLEGVRARSDSFRVFWDRVEALVLEVV